MPPCGGPRLGQIHHSLSPDLTQVSDLWACPPTAAGADLAPPGRLPCGPQASAKPPHSSGAALTFKSYSDYFSINAILGSYDTSLFSYVGNSGVALAATWKVSTRDLMAWGISRKVRGRGLVPKALGTVVLSRPWA